MTIRRYSELRTLATFEERYDYLQLLGQVGEETFGSERYLNQSFYRSAEWKRIRNHVIVRDNGCDMGIPGREIYDKIIIHHMNPMGARDLIHGNADILDPEFLISVTHNTHNAIHYGDRTKLVRAYEPRTPNDTVPWL